jgi:chemotaxis protein CheZ
VELAECIQAAKRTIPAIQADVITARDIPAANDELDAIGTHLEQAAGVILDSCESIETAVRDAPPTVAEAVQAATTRIYEACIFQDITGQRISKIVATLTTIEQRIIALLAALAPAFPTPGHHDVGADPGRLDGTATPEQQLLNGPQLPSKAPNQTDIDALLARLS